MTLWWKISVVEAVLVCCPECTGWRGSHISLPWLNRAWCITPLTHNHPSFLSSSFCPKLRYTPRYPSINTKETLQRLLFGESMFRWPSSNFQTLRINWTRPLSTPSSTAFIVRSDKVKTCRLITVHVYAISYTRVTIERLWKCKATRRAGNTWILSQQTRHNIFPAVSYCMSDAFTPLCQYSHRYLPDQPASG